MIYTLKENEIGCESYVFKIQHELEVGVISAVDH